MQKAPLAGTSVGCTRPKKTLPKGFFGHGEEALGIGGGSERELALPLETRA
jgi:hypothetical protein